MSPDRTSANKDWPFIGLRPFEFEDHEYFFGREKQVETLTSRVTKARFVAIVGSSGSGKSSLIKAGLRPKLGLPDRWIEMRPGNAPIRQLAWALAKLARPDEALDPGDKAIELLHAQADRFEPVLAKSSLALVEALKSIRKQFEGGRVFLLVDQFEELFRFAKLRSESLTPTAFERSSEATEFVCLLLEAAKSDVPIHIVVTMRSDFIGDCWHFHELPETVSKNMFLVPGMTRAQREEVIRKPLKRAGSKIEIDPKLVQLALNDTDNEPDQLPILQHAMMKCWELARGRFEQGEDKQPHLRTADYTKIGGVAKALSVHANSILEDLQREEATKRVFQALTDTEQEGRSVRRPQRFGDLVQYVVPGDASESIATKEARQAALNAAREATRAVVARFARKDCSFLQILDSNAASFDDESIIDIGHEALIRRWNKLGGKSEETWINEEQEDKNKILDLLRYADADDDIPLKQLPRLADWWFERKPNSFWAQRYRPKAEKFERIPEVIARSRAAINRAIEEKRQNEVRVIAIVADAIRNPRRLSGAADGLTWALRNKREGFPNVREYIEFLYNGLGELREKRRIYSPAKQIYALSFAPTGKLLAAAAPDETLFFDADTGKHIHTEQTPGWPLSLQWSPDATRIYVGTSPEGRILAVGSIKKLSEYVTGSGEHVKVGKEESPAGFGAWSHDGKWIVVAGWQRRASIWDTMEGRFVKQIADKRLEHHPLDYLSSAIAASADGRRFALGAASGKIHIFSTDRTGDKFSLTLETSLDAIENKASPYSLVFDPRGDQLLVAYMASPYMVLWKIDEKVPRFFGDKESGPVWRVAFDPKGEFVASATNDAVVRLWTPSGVADPDNAIQLRGHLSPVYALDISPQNGNIASATFDGTIRFWVKDSPLSQEKLSTPVSMPAASEFSVQDGRISITADGSNCHSGELPKGIDAVSAAAVTADGASIAIVPKKKGRPVLLVKCDDQNARATITLDGAKAEWTAVAFIDNDTRVMAKTKDGKVFVWPFNPDAPSLEQLARNHLEHVGSSEQLSSFDLPPIS